MTDAITHRGTASAKATAIGIALALLPFTIGTARADFPEYVKTACKKDFKTFCPSYPMNSPALRQCMRSSQKRLSQRCIDALERSGERR